MTWRDHAKMWGFALVAGGFIASVRADLRQPRGAFFTEALLIAAFVAFCYYLGWRSGRAQEAAYSRAMLSIVRRTLAAAPPEQRSAYALGLLRTAEDALESRDKRIEAPQ